MQQLFEIDLHDYEGCTKVFSRPSARGIIVGDGKMALVYSRKEKYYKFPGGGIHGREDKKTALIREVREETGLVVMPESITEFGIVMRRQKSNHSPDTVFEQENFYYTCRVERVEEEIAEQRLDDYEREAEFTLRYVPIEEAIRVNEAYRTDDFFNEIMIRREAKVLRIIHKAMITQALLPYAYVMSTFPEEERIYTEEYSSMLDTLLERHPENRFLRELEAVSGAVQSAAFILEHSEYCVVAPDDFGRVFVKLLRIVYENMELSAFAKSMYELWGKLPDGIINTPPFITLCYADDSLLACGEEAQTRRLYENLFNYYD